MATRCLNKVQLIGNLTRDPELKYTPQGAAICTFGVATNRSWVTSEGEKKESVEFHQIVAWQKLAELCEQLLNKGSKVYVEGRLKTRRWEDDNGTRRSKTEIVINRMIVLDSKNYDSSEDAEEPEDDEDLEEIFEPEDDEEEKEEKEEEKEKGKKKDKKENEAEEEDQEVDADDIPF
jgi:single-strand DNA-binding protein